MNRTCGHWSGEPPFTVIMRQDGAAIGYDICFYCLQLLVGKLTAVADKTDELRFAERELDKAFK